MVAQPNGGVRTAPPNGGPDSVPMSLASRLREPVRPPSVFRQTSKYKRASTNDVLTQNEPLARYANRLLCPGQNLNMLFIYANVRTNFL